MILQHGNCCKCNRRAAEQALQLVWFIRNTSSCLRCLFLIFTASIPNMKIVKFLLLVLLCNGVMAQKQKTPALKKNEGFHRCGTQFVMDELQKKYPLLKQEWISNRKKVTEQYAALQKQLEQRTNVTYTIPVVVHIVLPNPNLVTDAQVQSQIDVLNEDYAGLNADSSRIPAAFKPFFGKGNLRFCLARTDLKGDATNGIVRTASNVISSPGLEDPVKITCKGGSDAWDGNRYLNIWVCTMPSGFLGYSFFASDPLSIVPLNERGFVNNYRFFGRGPGATAPFNLGRTATHEIGHFFDLLHVWGPNNCDGTQTCSDDDEIADTPPQFKCTFGAPRADSVITDDCTANAPGIMWMNYMDYTDDRGMVLYTPGQYNRMNAAILTNSWLLQLATSNACTPVNRTLDARFENFLDPGFEACGKAGSFIYNCSNSYRPLVSYRNVGTDTIRTMVFTARFGSGTPVVTNWSGTLPPFTTVSFQLNAMNLNPGLNANLLVYTSNPNNGTDQKLSNDTGRISGVYYPTGNTPLTEAFENTGFPPSNWQVFNPDNAITWQRTTVAKASGTASMFINNFDYDANNTSDFFFSPLLPIKGKDSAFLTFKVAAATFNRPDLQGNPTDTLQILVTADCGNTYQSVYKKWGLNLVTTGNVEVDTGYVPLPSQWRRDSVFLGDFSSTNADNIRVAFRNITNFENNIYIDDINIFTKEVNPNLKRKGVMATPNPFNNRFVIQHYPNPQNIEYMQLINNLGQIVWQKRIAVGQAGNVFGPNYLEVDASSLAPGMYTLQIVYRNRKNETIKLVKMN
jgi:hypothetical protein